MKKLLNKFADWLKIKTCSHSNRLKVSIDYQEGYTKELCLLCGKVIFYDL